MINIKRPFFILSFVAMAICSHAQNIFQLDEQRIMKNMNLDFFVVKLQTEHFTTFSSKDKIPSFIKEQLPFINDSSIANPNEEYNATDLVLNEHFPWRQIRYGAISNDVLVLFYYKGGFASNNVVVLVSFSNNAVEDVWISHSFCDDVNSISSLLNCLNQNFKDKQVVGEIPNY